MIIETADLGNSPKHLDIVVQASDIDLESENVRLIDGVKLIADVSRNEAEIDVKGRIDYKAEIDCTRCLKPIERQAAIGFDINYVGPEQFAADKEHEVGGQALETDVLEGERIDVNAIVREQILLDVPQTLFCKEDCKGLCPKCGEDRNLIDCKCEEEEFDPRWAALKDLK